MNINQLASDLDLITTRLRDLYKRASRMEQRNELGEAARIPDELARAIACVAGARDAAAFEAFGAANIITEEVA